MHVEGTFAPDSVEVARDRYDALGPVAQTVVREVAAAMAFDREEYDERVTPEVIETAREALFASLLHVQVGDRTEFEAWRADFNGEVSVIGSEQVDHVVWHAAPDGRAVAATFQDEPDAAVGTLRRQAFGRVYQELVR